MKNYKLKIYAGVWIVFGMAFFALMNVSYSQEENAVLAKVGTSEITVEEFRDRYEFMPHLNYSNDDLNTVKKEFLYSLIAEKLWALEGAQRRFDTLESVKYSFESLRRLLIKDELYKTEVEPKIKISNDEINTGLQRVTLELFVKIISTEDSSEIFRISDQLLKGADFDSVLSTRKENNLQQTPVRIVYGSIEDENVEDLLFGMNPGSISLPIKSGEGWFIFKLVSENQNPGINLSSEHAKNLVKKTLQDRKVQQVGSAYLDSLIGGRRIEADKKIFFKIFDSMYDVLSTEYTSKLNDSLFNLILSEKQILKTINKVNLSELNSPFIKFEDGSASARDFLYYLYYQKFELNNLSEEHIKKTLSAAVRNYIEDEMLVREGIKRGLTNNREVMNGVSMWRDHYMSKLMMESFYDSAKISEDESSDYLDLKNNDTTSVEQKSVFKTQLELNKLQNILTEKTIEYAKKYSLQIYDQVIDNLELSELNTFTYKLIGFGGRIAAFPITIPMYEWYYLMQNEKTSLP
ncbi:MAG: peptidyl-prolyl cis-trans isomerase [Ignavibacteriaceae bacterium]|nr:peptidyl-prolyl cis-trans isomerase [Ignavibacteriaceae bacterium]